MKYTFDEIVERYKVCQRNDAWRDFLSLDTVQRDEFLAHLYTIEEYNLLRKFAQRLSGVFRA